MKWTDAQQNALSARNKNLLLSAAAGSGKTAVLVERIIRRITDPADPADVNTFLVLTFTRSAAAEMQGRIGEALAARLREAAAHASGLPSAEDAANIQHLQRQMTLLGSASISTIDAFCQSVLRQYFYRLDLDPDFRILSDENERYLLQEDVLAGVLLSWYEKKDPAFEDCADLFASDYQDARLRAALLRIYNFSLSLAFPEEFLAHLADVYDTGQAKDAGQLPWAAPLLEGFADRARAWQARYRRIFSLIDEEPALAPYSDMVSNEFAAFSVLTEAPDPPSWEDWYRILNAGIFGRLPAVRRASAADPLHFEQCKKEVQDLRDAVKKDYNDIYESYFSVPPAQWVSDMANTQPLMRALSAVLLDFHKAYRARKKKEGLMEFNDMEHYTLRLLLDEKSTPSHLIRSDVALALQQKYKEVMVDEYQDTNSLQELITALISNGKNRFLVGDIKQSIYRFRQADPGIFLEKYTSFRAEQAENLRIDLNQNFRSAPSILRGINFIFSQIMQRQSDGKIPLGLDYGEAEALHPGREEERSPSALSPAVDIELLDLAGGENTGEGGDPGKIDIDKTDLEAQLIADRIEALMQSGASVREKDGTPRPLAYSDIVILLRAVQGKAPVLLKALRARNIPAACEQTDDFFSAAEVQILWAILKILDNPRQDLALAAVLRSPFVSLSEESLAQLHLASPDSLWDALRDAASTVSEEQALRCVRFLSQYRSWRALSRQGGIAPLIEAILNDTDFLTYLGGMEGSGFRRAHILSFYEAARAWDAEQSGGLYRFLTYLQQTEDSARQLQQRASVPAAEGAVRIMTIHKSKGLEFPVVFLSSASSKFNRRDTNEIAILHKDLGLGLYHFDRDHLCRWPTLFYYAVQDAVRRESLAEEARLLYVAMTRARDKLIITGTVKDSEAALSSWASGLSGDDQGMPPLPAHRITSAQCYLDWILPAALRSRSLASLWDQIPSGLPAYITPAPGEAPSFTCHIHPLSAYLKEQETAPAQDRPAESTAQFLAAPAAPPPDWITRRFQWTYAHAGAVATPAKLTATAAVKLAEADKEEIMPSALLAEPIETPQSLPADFAAPPAFLAEAADAYAGTSYGTLMHKAMEKLDLAVLPPDKEAVSAAIRALTESRTFTEEEAAILLGRGGRPIEDILAFLKSPLGGLMQRASSVRKEMPFAILLPAKQFYPDCEAGETIFLQGAIDCLLEKEGKLVIIDYKTDHVPDGALLRDHYHRQLQIYADAMEQILQKPVAALYLWSFHLKEMIRVPRA